MQLKRRMVPLDFSSFRNILLEAEDGDIRPMSEPYFRAEEIAPGTWKVLSDGDFSYVLEGDHELMVIDSGYGAGNIRQFCQTLSNKPLHRLLNTHSHLDHTANNYLFDVVYMSKTCYSMRRSTTPLFQPLEFPLDYPVVFLKDGDRVDLAGRELEVIHCQEHCMGSLQYLDRRERILFCGDELNGNFFDSKISVEHSLRNMARWREYRKDFDTLCAGNGVYDAVYVDRYYEALRYILDGHANEGVEMYIPWEDPKASRTMLDGKRVYPRRSPRMDPFSLLVEEQSAQGLRDPYFSRRKMSADGPFDRQLEKFGCKVCYYLNRLYDEK